MIFEIAGFMCGVAGIGSAFWRLYRRDSTRVVETVYCGSPVRPRG